MQHTMPASTDAPLLQALLTLLDDARPTFRQQRSYRRALALIFGMLFSLARHTLTQALLAAGYGDVDWSPFYRLFTRERIRMPLLQRRLIQQTLLHSSPSDLIMLAVDGVAFPRASRRMPGVGWRKAPNTAPFRPGLSLAQRFGALHWLPPLTHGYTRAIPLLSYPIFTPKAHPAKAPPQTEWQGALDALTTLREELTIANRAEQHLVLLADGSYDVADVWKALPAHTSLAVRTARNRVLYKFPEPEAPRRGARRKYGVEAPRPAEYLQQRKGWQKRSVEVRGYQRSVRFRVEGPFLRAGVAGQGVFLVLMGGERYRRDQRQKYREPVPVLVSGVAQADGGWALPLPIDELLAWLWQRWEVEVAHRELKSGFGVGEMQCWNAVSTVATVQWGIWLYAICLLAAYRTWGICGGPQPPGRWRKQAGRWSFTTLWRSLRMSALRSGELEGGWRRPPSNGGTKEVGGLQMLRSLHMTARL